MSSCSIALIKGFVRRGRPMLLLSGLIFFLYSAGAQTILHGTVTDKANKPVAGVNVLLLHAGDSTLVKGAMAGERGAWSLTDCKPGSYILSFSGVGYARATVPLTVAGGKENKDLGVQVLEESGGQLAVATVTAQKPLFEQKIDRMVVNVQNNITATGSTILDILERSPGVIVDRQNNSISLIGKSGVVVMINGKINRMPIDAVIQLLAGLSAGNVEKIELITTPPANLDAEGNAGYINIVLKENNQYGTNGSFSLTMGYGNRDMPQASINFNHREGKINIYGDYSFSRIHSEQDWIFNHQVNNAGITTQTNTATYRNTVQRNHNARLGMDYQVSRNTVIGVLFSGYNNKWTMDANNTSTITVDKSVDTVLQIANTEKNQWTNYGVNINIQHNFSEKEKISFNSDYLHYLDDNPNTYTNTYYDGDKNFLFEQQTRSSKVTPIHFLVNALDYSKKIAKAANLEAGLKSTVSTFHNDVEIERAMQNGWIRDPGLSAKYALNEDIEAAYASLSAPLGSKTDLKAGLRYEYTNSNLGSDSIKNIVDKHYGNLFPSLYITRRLNEDNTLGLSYSRRITRPTFNDMAPFTIFIDPTTFFSGNPALQPSISDAVKADYGYKKLVLSVSYAYEKNTIANFNPTVDSITNVETLSAVNLHSDQTLAAVLTLPLNLKPWWSITFSATAVWEQMNTILNKTPLQIIQKSLNLNGSQTFKLPKDLSFEVSGFYQSPTLFGIYKAAAYGSLDVGIQKKLGKGNLRFTYSNILNTMKFDLSVDRPDLNLVLRQELHFVFPAVRLTYSRSFGNDKLKETRQRSTGSEEEKGRVH